MNTFGNRLKEERARLKLNQLKFAELGGVKKNAQISYEKGERSPDVSYLEGLEKAGVDTGYLISGERLYDHALKAMERTPRYAEIYLRLKRIEERLAVKFEQGELEYLGKYANTFFPTEEGLQEFIKLSRDFREPEESK